MTLEPGWLLTKTERKRRPSMTAEEAVALLEDLAADTSDRSELRAGARLALDLIRDRGADARLLALTLEAVASDVDLGPGSGGSSSRRKVE